MFKDFYYPDGTQPTWKEIDTLQRMFMKWFNKLRLQQIVAFPVETFAMVHDGKDIVDKDYKDLCAEMYSEGHSFFTYISDSADSLASCCRLRNELTENTFNPTSGLTGVMTGSCNVITLNINRIVQDTYREIRKLPLDLPERPDRLPNKTGTIYTNLKRDLIEILERVYKYHIAYKTMLYDLEDKGMFAASNGGYIHISKLYSTIGINGLNEAAEFLGFGAVAVTGGLEGAAGGEGGQHLDHDVTGQGVHDHDIGGAHQNVVATQDSAAVSAGRGCPLEVEAAFTQLVQSHLSLTSAVDIQDTDSGLSNTAGLGSDDAGDGIQDHALDAVGGRGASGVSHEHLLALSGGDHTTNGGNTDGEGIVHGDSAVDLAGSQHLVHLLVTLVLVRNVDGGDTGSLQGADVVNIDAAVSSHLSSSDGVNLAVLTAHTGQSDLGTAAEGAGLQTVSHFHKGIGNDLFNISHGSPSLILLQPAGMQRTHAETWRSSS